MEGGGFCTGVAIDSNGNAYVGGESIPSEGILYEASAEAVWAPTLFPYITARIITRSPGSFDAILMQITRVVPR